MKKQLQQITLFDAPAEDPAPAEKVTLSNTAPTPPRIVEIFEEEEKEQPQIDVPDEFASTAMEETDSAQTEQESAETVVPVTTAPTPPVIVELTDEEVEEPSTAEAEDLYSSITIEETPPILAEEELPEPETTPAATAPVPPRIIEITPEESGRSTETTEERIVAPASKVSFIQTEPEEKIIAGEPPLPKRISSTRGRKSLKETAIAADLIQIPEDDLLFAKQYYSIGEVATMFRENQSLIRYWETEFDILQPRKNKKGDRFFRPVDIKNLVLIYDLLRRRKFTIEGAKDFLKRNKKVEDKFAMIQSLEKIKSFLLELRTNL
jgi:DNA-binding transcriptional MerR regulator